VICISHPHRGGRALALFTILAATLPLASVPSLAGADPGAAPAGTASHSTVPGAISFESTMQCIGLKWLISGDDDLDCRVTVAYRRYGTDGWRAAQPLLRVEPGSYNGNGIDPGNLLAGSIFNLTGGLTYEVRLTLSDPDGGFADRTLLIDTRPEPEDSPTLRWRYVVPGSGGGSGTTLDPFRGIAAANAAAEPGDLFLLQPGVYTESVVFTASGTETAPIIWRGLHPAVVTLDGGGTAPVVVEFRNTQHVRLENVSIIRPQRRAVVGTGSVASVIRYCVIRVDDVPGYDMTAIDFRGPGQRDALITNNVIIGYTNWEEGHTDDDSYAVLITGTGHVIRHNRISDWWDGLNVGADDASIETSNCDIYRNEIFNCTDDGIETDGSRHNIRIFDNRFTNVLCGVSCQPVYGGPVYIVRNAVYNWQLKPLKFHVWPTGIVVYNNTFVGADPRGWGGGQWRNVVAKNNIFVGGSQSAPQGDPIPLETDGVRADLDYNGWHQAWPGRFAYFNSVYYTSREAFHTGTGMEGHGVLLDIGVFVRAEEPPLGSYLGESGFFPPYAPGSQVLGLLPNSAAVDAGVFLPNITDGFFGRAPDLGAYELRTAAVADYGTDDPAISASALATSEPGASRTGAAGASDDASAATADASGSSPEGPAPGMSRLLPAFPNPFRGTAQITYELPQESWVTVSIFDVAGRMIRLLEQPAQRAAGRHDATWDGRDDAAREVASGTYILWLETDGLTMTRKIVRSR